MLSYSVGALRAQRQHIKGNEQYTEAYKAGVRHEQGNYGDWLVDEVRAHIRQREWGEAFSGALVLARYYPRGFTLLSERHIGRHRFALRIRRRKQELEDYERHLKQLEDAQEVGSGSAWLVEDLREASQQVQWLRERLKGSGRRQADQDDLLVGEVRAHLQQREWGRAFSGALVLARYYPRGLALLLMNKQGMELRRLARRLHALVQDLEGYEWQLKQLEAVIREDSRNALVEERQKASQWLQRLRRHIRGLEREIGDLNRGQQNDLNHRAALLIRRSKRQFNDYERYLKQLASTPEDAKSALLEERRKASQWIQQLRGHIGGLEREIRNLDQPSRIERNGNLRELSKRIVGHLRAKEPSS